MNVLEISPGLARRALGTVAMAGLAVAAIGVALPRVAHAAPVNTYTVTDTEDAGLGTGHQCDASAGDRCTLRAAIEKVDAADAASSDQTPIINVGAGTFTVTTPLSVSKPVTIRGAGAGATSVAGQKGASGPTVSDVFLTNTDAGTTTRLQDLTVRDGHQGIFNGGDGGLTLTRVNVTGNTDGGGVSSLSGNLGIYSGSITNNTGAFGGVFTGSHAQLQIDQEEVPHSESGAAVPPNDGSPDPHAKDPGTEIAGNTADPKILNDALLVSGNGGGINSHHAIDIKNAYIHDNKAVNGAGLFITGNETNFAQSPAGNIDSTTISGNHATGDGGGIDIAYANNSDGTGHLTVLDSTFNNNRADGSGGAIVANDPSTSEYDFVTIAGNSAQTGSGVAVKQQQVEARRADATTSASHTFHNTIIADNMNGAANLNNCAAPAGSLGSLPASDRNKGGHNLDSGSTCGLAGDGDLQNTEPKLNGLQMNPGPAAFTPTMALGADSPAIGKGDPEDLIVDQRGVNRVDGPDIGAFQLEGASGHGPGGTNTTGTLPNPPTTGTGPESWLARLAGFLFGI